MALFDKMFERIVNTIQAEVPEPVVAIGALQPAGSYGAFALGKLSPAVGTFRQHRANKAAGALTGRHGLKFNHHTYFALTADKLYVFDTKPTRTGVRVRSTLAVWDRADVTVQLVPGRAATKVVLDHVDAGHYELEAPTITRHNDALISELRALTGS